MAAADYYVVTQQLYISYFGRPADPRGLEAFAQALSDAGAPTGVVELSAAYKTNAAIKGLVDGFGASTESAKLYASGDVDTFVNSVFLNVLGRPAKFAGLNYWNAEITSGRVTKAEAAMKIMAGAFANTTDPTQAAIDQAVINAKVAVASNFTHAIDSAETLMAYKGATAAGTARTMLQSVSDLTNVSAFNATIASTLVDLVAAAVPTTTTALTVGVDTLTGGISNDVFNANAQTLSALDTINGGNGIDTLNISGVNVAGTATAIDLTLPSSVTNVEKLIITATAMPQGLALGAANLSGFTGLQSANINLGAITAANTITAGAADVTLTTSGGAALTVNGGKAVTIRTGTVAADDIHVVGGDAATSVTITGGHAIDISDAGGEADTIATVSLSGFTAASTVNSDALKTVTVANTAATLGVTAKALTTLNVTKISSVVTVSGSDAGTRVLTINANGATAGAGVTDDAATGVALAVTGAATDLSLHTDAATSLTITGDKALTLARNLDSTLDTINASGLNANLTVSSIIQAGQAYTGASGVDTITVEANNAKAINTGAGDDVVTVSGAIGNGGSIDGGAGMNTLVMTAVQAAARTTDDVFSKAISNFQKLSIDAVGTGIATINLANLDNISYIKSAGAGAVAAATPEVQTIALNAVPAAVSEVQTITVSGTATGAGSIIVGNVVINLAGTETATQIASAIVLAEAAIKAQNNTIASVTSSAGVVTVTYNGVAGDVANIQTNANTAATGVATLAVGTTTIGDTNSGNITFAGVSVGVTGGQSAGSVATAIAAQSAAIIAANPTIASVSASGNNVVVTYTGAAGDVATFPALTDPAATGFSFASSTETTKGIPAPTGGFALTNAAANSTLELNGAVQTGSSISLADAGGNADKLNLVFSAAAGFSNTAAITAAGVETIAITTADTDTGALSSFVAPIIATAVKTVTVAGNVGIDLTGLTATTLTSFDASGVTGSGAAGAVTLTTGALAAEATISTGAGDDMITATLATKAVTINTGAGNDTVTVANDQANVVTTGAGNDIVTMNNGNNTVTAGDGNDTVTLGSGNNTVSLGDGNDIVTVTTGNNTIDGGAGNDTITVTTGSNTIMAGAGDDVIHLGLSAGLNKIDLGAGNDKVVFDAAPKAAGFYAAISSIGGGDMLDFSAISANDAGITGTAKLGAKLTLGAASSFANYLDAATAGNTGAATSVIKWFQFTDGNTYIVVDHSNGMTFQDGVDTVVQLVGTVDLSNATTTSTHLITLA